MCEVEIPVFWELTYSSTLPCEYLLCLLDTKVQGFAFSCSLLAPWYCKLVNHVAQLSRMISGPCIFVSKRWAASAFSCATLGSSLLFNGSSLYALVPQLLDYRHVGLKEQDM